MFFANGAQAGDVVPVGGTNLQFSNPITHMALSWWGNFRCECAMSHLEIYYGRLEASHAAQSMQRQLPGPGCSPPEEE